MLKRIFFTATLLASIAANSWQEFHGGDEESVEFYLFLKSTVDYFDEIPILYEYKKGVNSVFDTQIVDVILTSDQIFIDGQEKVAMVKKSFRKQACSIENKCEIVVNLNKWKVLDKNTRLLLILHEISNLNEPPDLNYTRSLKYYNVIKSFEKYGKTRNEIEMEIVREFERCTWGLYVDIFWLVNEKSFSRGLIEKVNKENLCSSAKEVLKFIESQD